MRRTSPTGLERMRALAGELPHDLVRGFRSGVELELARSAGDRPIYAVGMGASAIAADLARGLVDAETPASLVVVRGPDLPAAVDRRTTVIVLSYSGTTTEAFEAYRQAGRRGASRVVVGSGGPLAESADADGVPVLRVPGGNPPRSAVGHLFGGILGLLDPIFAESNERRLELAAEELRGRLPLLGSSRGPAAPVARRIAGRLPFVVGERALAGLARRWTSQLEENAKQLAAFDELPESLHNALVGWDALRPKDASRYALVLLEWSRADPLVRQAARHLARVARARRVRTLEVPLPPEDRLGALVHGVALGDAVSLELARLRHVDPFPITAITRGRAALAAVRPES